MKNFVKSMDKLPLIVKVLFSLPILDGLIYGIYRIAKGHVIAGILWIFLGGSILWIVDLITMFTNGKPVLFA